MAEILHTGFSYNCQKKLLTRFFYFGLGAEIGLKNCQNFIKDGRLSLFFFNSSYNIKAKELIFCMNTA